MGCNIPKIQGIIHRGNGCSHLPMLPALAYEDNAKRKGKKAERHTLEGGVVGFDAGIAKIRKIYPFLGL